MKYVRKSPQNITVEEQYILQKYDIDNVLNCVNAILLHVFIDSKLELSVETLMLHLDDSMSEVVDSSFEYTKANVEKLMVDDPLFSANDPLTWARVQDRLPKTVKEERKFFTRVSKKDGFTEEEIINCFVDKGDLPAGHEWSIKA
jgi:hypothetical protein